VDDRPLPTHAGQVGPSGRPGAVRIPPPEITISPVIVEPEIVPLGENVTLSLTIESQSDQALTLMIDYIVYLMRANGKQNPKVFKLTRKTLEPGEVLTIKRNHSFKR